MQSFKILKLEQNISDSTTVEFIQQCSCQVSSLLFAGSFDPDIFKSISNLTITFEINEIFQKIVTSPTVQMTDSINVFRSFIPNNMIEILENRINISGQISIEGGINMHLNENDTALVHVVAGKFLPNYSL